MCDCVTVNYIYGGLPRRGSDSRPEAFAMFRPCQLLRQKRERGHAGWGLGFGDLPGRLAIVGIEAEH